jgi:hypothetical protein
MFMRARVCVCLAVLIAVALAGCTGSPEPESSRESLKISGQVLDADTSEPISGAVVAGEDQQFTTGPDGAFSLSDLSSGSNITVDACAYAPASLSVSENTRGTQTIELNPLPVTGRITSNLSSKGIRASLKGDASTKAETNGKFSLEGVCPESEIEVSAAGYQATFVTVDETREIKVELLADPATTYEKSVAWEAAQKWEKSCDLLHPDNRKWISKAQCISGLKRLASQGYQAVSIRIKSVTFIKWTFPRCSLDDFGPKTYRHTAAIRYTEQQATPSGGVEPVSGIAHWVQTDDGLWRWFLNWNCSLPLP